MGRKRRTCEWVKAEGTSLTEISRFVQDWLSLQEVYRDSRKERYLVELAVIEACTNIIRYAYPASSPGHLSIPRGYVYPIFINPTKGATASS